MFFQSWSDFFAMGGYGFYVWLAYGVTLMSLIVLACWELFRRKQFIQQQKRQRMREMRLAKRTKV